MGFCSKNHDEFVMEIVIFKFLEIIFANVSDKSVCKVTLLLCVQTVTLDEHWSSDAPITNNFSTDDIVPCVR